MPVPYGPLGSSTGAQVLEQERDAPVFIAARFGRYGFHGQLIKTLRAPLVQRTPRLVSPAFDSIVVSRAAPNLQLRAGNQNILLLPAQGFDEPGRARSDQLERIISRREKAVVFIECKRSVAVSLRLEPRSFSCLHRDRDLMPTNLVAGFAPRGGDCRVEAEIQECFLAGFHGNG